MHRKRQVIDWKNFALAIPPRRNSTNCDKSGLAEKRMAKSGLLISAAIAPMSAVMVASNTLDRFVPAHPGSDAHRWWRTLAGFPTVLAAALATTVVIFANRNIADPDIWWHLRNADELVRTGHFVRADAYSYTVLGAPWINHEWLGELPYYLGWRWLGLRGLYLVMVLALVAIVLLLYRVAYVRAHDYKAAALACGFALPLATVSFGPRTLLFGWIFLLLELLILETYDSHPQRLWLLPPLFVLWVNTHGSWLIGLALLIAFAAAGYCDVHAGRIKSARRSLTELKQLAAVITCSTVALLVNPYGWHLVFYPFDLAFRQKLNVSHVEEWQSPNFHALRGKLLLAMLLGFVVLALVRGGSFRLHEVLFVLVAFYAALTYTRFLFLAAIILTPVLAAEISLRGFGGRTTADKAGLNMLMIGAMVAIMGWQAPSNAQLSTGIVEEYPVAALSHLNSIPAGIRILNDYDWGGYLIWNARQLPVFIDSRVDIFEYSGIFADYLDIMGLKNSLELLHKHDIHYVLFARQKPLTYLLRNSAGWKIIYEDNVAVLFERTD